MMRIQICAVDKLAMTLLRNDDGLSSVQPILLFLALPALQLNGWNNKAHQTCP